VDLALLERLVESQMAPDGRIDLYLVDEIGIVASWMDRFPLAMDVLLDSEVKVVAVIHAGRGGYVEQVRSRPDVAIREVTQGNRDSMYSDVLAWVNAR
jgi:nucleoside-triphosphatase THEP1